MRVIGGGRFEIADMTGAVDDLKLHVRARRLVVDPPGDGADFRAAAEVCGLPFSVVSFDDQAARDAWGARRILVRPDQFVAWTGDGVAAAGEVLARARGAI